MRYPITRKRQIPPPTPCQYYRLEEQKKKELSRARFLLFWFARVVGIRGNPSQNIALLEGLVAAASGILRLPDSERHVSILDHVLDLAPHYRQIMLGSRLDETGSPANGLTRQEEKDKPVHNQDWPKYWEIEHLEPGADESNSDSLGRRVPELKLRQSPNKRPEFRILLGGQP